MRPGLPPGEGGLSSPFPLPGSLDMDLSDHEILSGGPRTNLGHHLPNRADRIENLRVLRKDLHLSIVGIEGKFAYLDGVLSAHFLTFRLGCGREAFASLPREG